MEKEKLIIVLLIVAILFSFTSIVVSVSLTNFNPVSDFSYRAVSQTSITGNQNGNVQLGIEVAPGVEK